MIRFWASHNHLGIRPALRGLGRYEWDHWAKRSDISIPEPSLTFQAHRNSWLHDTSNRTSVISFKTRIKLDFWPPSAVPHTPWLSVGDHAILHGPGQKPCSHLWHLSFTPHVLHMRKPSVSSRNPTSLTPSVAATPASELINLRPRRLLRRGAPQDSLSAEETVWSFEILGRIMSPLKDLRRLAMSFRVKAKTFTWAPTPCVKRPVFSSLTPSLFSPPWPCSLQSGHAGLLTAPWPSQTCCHCGAFTPAVPSARHPLFHVDS